MGGLARWKRVAVLWAIMGNGCCVSSRGKQGVLIATDGGTVNADESVGGKTQAETEKSDDASWRKPVYVGCVAEGDYQGLLYFDSGSTGTRPYVFIRRSADASVSEFWQLTWAQEARQVRIHTCVSSEAHGNEELLRRLRGSPDEGDKLGLLEGLRLSQEFTDYIADAISQARNIVSSAMQTEAGHGVKFWSNGSALRISDIMVAITGGLRSAVGESPAVLREVDTRLTELLTSKLQQASNPSGVRLVAKLLPGSEEARCEAAAVRVLSAMQGSASLGGASSGVISMGGASVQVSVNGTSLCIPMGRNRAIEAAHKADGEPGHLDDFRAEFAAARAAALAEHLELIESSRTWIAVSGLYYTARDLGIRLEEPLDLAEARADIRARALAAARESEASEGEDPATVDARAGSAACALEVLATLSGRVVFQREWLNPATNQRLAATVSTGYVVSHLGYAGELPELPTE